MTHLVVWCLEDTFGILTDHWEAHDSLEGAKKMYNGLLERDDVYTASVCKPILSTDYDT